jgi:hypothetical protein
MCEFVPAKKSNVPYLLRLSTPPHMMIATVRGVYAAQRLLAMADRHSVEDGTHEICIYPALFPVMCLFV